MANFGEDDRPSSYPPVHQADRTGLYRIAAIAVVVAVVAAIIAVPIVLSKPYVPPVLIPIYTPAPTFATPPVSVAAAPNPTATPTPTPTSVVTQAPTAGPVVKPTPPPWWAVNTVSSLPAVTGGQSGWVQVVGPSQCEAAVAYSSTLGTPLGAFGPPSSSPRQLTFNAPNILVLPSGNTMNGHVTITCYQGSLGSAPNHVWTLPLTVTASTPPPWAYSAVSPVNAAPGGTLLLNFTTTLATACNVKWTLPSGAVTNDSLSGPGTSSLPLGPTETPGTVHWTLSCTASSYTIITSGNAQVL
jgi:hypothetical protein